MTRLNLQNIYFKKRTPESLKNTRNKITTIVNYIKENSKLFLVTWTIQAIYCDNKTFWKYIQPSFSEKRKISNKITLVDDNDTIVSGPINIRRIKHFF